MAVVVKKLQVAERNIFCFPGKSLWETGGEIDPEEVSVREDTEYGSSGAVAVKPSGTRPNSGDKVAGGIYAYLITDGQENELRGKVGMVK